MPLRDFFRKYPTLFLLAAVAVAANVCYSAIIPLVPFYFRAKFHDPGHAGAIFELLKGFRHSEALIGFLKGLGHSDMLIGLAYSAYVFSEMCFKPVAGTLGDRFRRTRLVMIGLFTGIVLGAILSRALPPRPSRWSWARYAVAVAVTAALVIGGGYLARYRFEARFGPEKPAPKPNLACVETWAAHPGTSELARDRRSRPPFSPSTHL